MSNKNNISIDKITELYLKNYDIEKENDIKLTIKKIKFVESQIESFKNMKPCFFSKKNKQTHNETIDKLEELREILYNSLGNLIND